MATTRIYPLHAGKGRSVAKALRDVTDYMENPLKTDGGELISSYECAHQTADSEFLLSKARYLSLTGRAQGKRDVIAYHSRQSFKPGEVTPQQANAIGYELAMRFTHGRHAFIVCTHNDKAHIHNHVVWNSTDLDCRRKWRDFFRSGRALRRLSDTLCIENGLSVIENPAHGQSKHYGEWLGDGKRLSHHDELRAAIDTALARRPASFDEFISLMRDAGYNVDTNRKHITFSLPEWKQQARMDTLKGDHTEAAVRQRIGDHSSLSSGGKETGAPVASRKPGLLIDIEAKLRQGKGEGYAHWARLFNLKQMAQTMLYLQEHGIGSLGELSEKAEAAVVRFSDLAGRIKGLETKLKANSELQTHIINYSKTRKVYEDYRKAGYSKKFRDAHDTDILLHKAAKETFDARGYGNGKRIPTIKTLRAQYDDALNEKKRNYAEYREARSEMKELLAAREYVHRILNAPDHQRKSGDERTDV